jgi:hypothetical protein
MLQIDLPYFSRAYISLAQAEAVTARRALILSEIGERRIHHRRRWYKLEGYLTK